MASESHKHHSLVCTAVHSYEEKNWKKNWNLLAGFSKRAGGSDITVLTGVSTAFYLSCEEIVEEIKLTSNEPEFMTIKVSH